MIEAIVTPRFIEKCRAAAVTFFAFGALTTPTHAATLNPRDTSVQMFHWKWTDVASECKNWLGPQGYGGVQISPPSSAQEGVNWYDIFQPVDYADLNSKMGSDAELERMIHACHASGVRVYADVVINHLAAGSGTATNGANWDAETLSYPRFSAKHFHENCEIQRSDYGTPGNRNAVTSCRLSGLPDLNTADSYVQAQIQNYLNSLINLGIDGFRIDAAKHIELSDLKSILNGVRATTAVGEKLWVTQEAIGDGNLDLLSYTSIGTVNEFKYLGAMKAAFRNEMGASISQLPAIMGTPENWGGSWKFVDSRDATVFVNNWDTERNGRSLNASNRTGAVNDTVGTKRYNLANIFMLAWPYGEAQMHSGFNFHNKDEDAPTASPFDAGGNPKINQDWDFIHRWPDISNMVAFRNTTSGQGVNNLTVGTDHQIAFNRGVKGFVAINNDTAPWTRSFQTKLPAGTYCNVVHGRLNAAKTNCTSDKVKVSSSGSITVTVPANDGLATPAIALHINQRLGRAPHAKSVATPAR